MSLDIANKVLRHKKDIDDVFELGSKKGEKKGYSEGHTTGFAKGYRVGYNEGGRNQLAEIDKSLDTILAVQNSLMGGSK